jgi:hypothetical protein
MRWGFYGLAIGSLAAYLVAVEGKEIFALVEPTMEA